MDAVSLRLARVIQNVRTTLISAGRDNDSVTIVGVTKALPYQMAVVGVQNGLFDLAESRVQEAIEKIPATENFLREYNVDFSQLTWHMIGKLQSNKAARAARLFDVIHSVESLKLANILSRTAKDEGKTLRVFIEVNTSGESQKGGISVNATSDFVAEISGLKNLYIEGLMTIGRNSEDEHETRTSFRLLRELNENISAEYGDSQYGQQLSMGMSGDYPLAIQEGSTMIRIGNGIFGPRA
jgi:pyridoxal phosphate enzyme (YggS family)